MVQERQFDLAELGIIQQDRSPVLIHLNLNWLSPRQTELEVPYGRKMIRHLVILIALINGAQGKVPVIG